MPEARTYLGLELGGAKNQRTTIAVLQFFPHEKKTFLLDVHEGIGTKGDKDDPKTGDELLLDIFNTYRKDLAHIGVDIPMELPPCLVCPRKNCPMPAKCTIPAVRWMREKNKDFTPYTQRPVELWLRYKLLPHIFPRFRFEIDETMGGTKAPRTARMVFLKRHLGKFPMIETLSKLTLAVMAQNFKFNPRYVSSYRQLDSGAHSREWLLEAIASKYSIFIYERDVTLLTKSLGAFDAFLSALTALLAESGLCALPPKGFPVASGWIYYPKLKE